MPNQSLQHIKINRFSGELYLSSVPDQQFFLMSYQKLFMCSYSKEKKQQQQKQAFSLLTGPTPTIPVVSFFFLSVLLLPLFRPLFVLLLRNMRMLYVTKLYNIVPCYNEVFCTYRVHELYLIVGAITTNGLKQNGQCSRCCL